MPEPKKKIELIAKEISFTDFSITYKVDIPGENTQGMVFSNPNIREKDLIMQPSYVDIENNEVSFVCSNVMPHFYKDVLDRTIRNVEEYIVELDRIYGVGDVIGYLVM